VQNKYPEKCCSARFSSRLSTTASREAYLLLPMNHEQVNVAHHLKEMVEKRKVFQELNALRTFSKELQIKFDNQKVQLEIAEKRLRIAEEQFSTFGGDGKPGVSEVEQELLKVKQQNHSLQSQFESSEAECKTLRHELVECQKLALAHEREYSERAQQMERLQKDKGDLQEDYRKLKTKKLEIEDELMSKMGQFADAQDALSQRTVLISGGYCPLNFFVFLNTGQSKRAPENGGTRKRASIRSISCKTSTLNIYIYIYIYISVSNCV
jgi:hypothetical protein